MHNNDTFVQVYLDTSAILKYSQINNIDNESRIILKELYELYNNGKISLFSLQGSFSDIFGDSFEKVKKLASKIAAEDREKTRLNHTLPLSAIERETNADFADFEIELFGIMFNMNVGIDGIIDLYQQLEVNDRNDYDILCDVFLDSNNYSYFITSNTKEFVSSVKQEKIEALARKYGKCLSIAGITHDFLREVKNKVENSQFSQICSMLVGCQRQETG